MVVRRMGAAEADQLCRSILGHEMSRLHLDGILTQPHLGRRRRVIADDGGEDRYRRRESR